MNILVVGSGGREHALVWKIAQSPLVKRIWCAPGNAGIAKIAECVDIMPESIEGLAHFARTQRIDLTVVGPEAPLCKGIVDHFENEKLRIFGPSKEAAEIEGSKVFCKNLLRRYGIPTANFRVFQQSKAAVAFVRSSKFPLVVKADGLAGGKGAVVCQNESEAVVAIEAMMEKKMFGKAGEQVLVEEFLNGVEVSLMALCDGQDLYVLETVQDHKRVYDGDRGPNTGGMGAYSPAPVVSEREYARAEREILVPIVHAMKSERRRFKGLLYAGIMLTKSGPKVLEFNARFGDPETQPLMLRWKSDLVPALQAVVDEKLEAHTIEWDPRPAACVVLTSAGYPGHYETGYEIEGADDVTDAVVFHAGTARREGRLVTAGGRVLGVTALGDDIAAARDKAYAAVKKISFRGAHYRTDIGARALAK